jgi:allantoin racemase
MRILVINPNTTTAMTDKVAAAAQRVLPEDAQVIAATGRFGPRYIASRASYAVACHAALEAFSEHGAGCDAVLLACFGDPGLDALREVSASPVISLIDAACAEAGASGRRFSIITGGDRWGPMLSEMLAARGLDSQLASIRTVAPSGGMIASDPKAAHALLADACRTAAEADGAGAVILGGTGLIGIAKAIQADVPVPVICSVEAGLNALVAALAGSRAAASPTATDTVDSIGLSPSLTRLFTHGVVKADLP